MLAPSIKIPDAPALGELEPVSVVVLVNHFDEYHRTSCICSLTCLFVVGQRAQIVRRVPVVTVEISIIDTASLTDEPLHVLLVGFSSEFVQTAESGLLLLTRFHLGRSPVEGMLAKVLMLEIGVDVCSD